MLNGKRQTMNHPIANIRGFNYQPSYAYNGADIWRRFDAATYGRELALGKQRFPKMNGVRLWLAAEVFSHGSDRQREQFLQNVDTAFGLAAQQGLAVMPVLFNRWHGGAPEWGGVFLDHLLPGAGWSQPGFLAGCAEYVDAVIDRFGKDPRVVAWDLCNEPFMYGPPPWDKFAEAGRQELAWLEGVYARCKERGAVAPLSVGFWLGAQFMEPFVHLCDILNFHLYFMGDPAKRDDFRQRLDECVALRERTGKPLISTEACWGSLDNAKRVEIIEFHLGELNRRNIGWLVYALQHSYIADLHWPEFGRVGNPGTLHCLEPDGSIRPGHDIINKYL
jgi:hypothetical protein